MADITTVLVDEDGKDPALVAANGGGDAFLNNGHALLMIKNDDASAKTVTVTAQVTTDTDARLGKLTKANRQISVPAGEIRLMGPFPPAAFNDAAGKIQVTYSAVTSVTVAVLRVL